MTELRLRFDPQLIPALAGRYEYQDDRPVREIGRRARRAGYFTRRDFLDVCYWKTRRSQSKCRRNTADEVKEITRIALSTDIERLRIDVLRCLYGVQWPTASVLLHIAHADPYPVLDVRALWSLGSDKNGGYSFSFWWDYVQVCRDIAQQAGVDMRTLDRALWQYSREHQGSLT